METSREVQRHYEIIETGSSGNCLIVEDVFMFDCGVPYKEIKDRFGVGKVRFIFISHEHRDHFLPSTVRKIAYEHPSVKFIVGAPLIKKLVECGVFERNIVTGDLGVWYDANVFKFKIDYLFHDVPNFCLHLEYHEKKILYCTDTSRVDHIEARGYNLYFIEANYDTDEGLDEEILQKQLKGEFTYLKRVKETHLSQLQAVNWLQENAEPYSKYIFIHQHKEKASEIDDERNNRGSA